MITLDPKWLTGDDGPELDDVTLLDDGKEPTAWWRDNEWREAVFTVARKCAEWRRKQPE